MARFRPQPRAAAAQRLTLHGCELRQAAQLGTFTAIWSL